mgnify:CR=1
SKDGAAGRAKRPFMPRLCAVPYRGAVMGCQYMARGWPVKWQ